MKVTLVKAVAKVKQIADNKLNEKELKEFDTLMTKVIEPVKDVKPSGNAPKTSENKNSNNE